MSPSTKLPKFEIYRLIKATAILSPSSMTTEPGSGPIDLSRLLNQIEIRQKSRLYRLANNPTLSYPETTYEFTFKHQYGTLVKQFPLRKQARFEIEYRCNVGYIYKLNLEGYMRPVHDEMTSNFEIRAKNVQKEVIIDPEAMCALNKAIASKKKLTGKIKALRDKMKRNALAALMPHNTADDDRPIIIMAEPEIDQDFTIEFNL